MSITEERISYIKEHKNLSANQIIENWKGSELAIKRKDGLKLIRETKGKRVKFNRKKYTPIKYRIVPSELKKKKGKIQLPSYPEKDGYYVAKIEVKRGVNKGQKYFIAYQDRKNFIDQRDKILNSYGHNYRDISVTFHGFKEYKPFVDSTFDLEVVSD